MVENFVYKTPLKHRMWRCSPNGHKSHRISDWKLKFKIICDYHAIYDIYIKTENCDYCGDSLVLQIVIIVIKNFNLYLIKKLVVIQDV